MSNAARTHETQSSGRRCNTFEALRWPGENIFSSVFRISQSQILVEPRSLYLGIMQLNNKELKSAAVNMKLLDTSGVSNGSMNLGKTVSVTCLMIGLIKICLH